MFDTGLGVCFCIGDIEATVIYVKVCQRHFGIYVKMSSLQIPLGVITHIELIPKNISLLTANKYYPSKPILPFRVINVFMQNSTK